MRQQWVVEDVVMIFAWSVTTNEMIWNIYIYINNSLFDW
jgi:hypothetical protein